MPDAINAGTDRALQAAEGTSASAGLHPHGPAASVLPYTMNSESSLQPAFAASVVLAPSSEALPAGKPAPSAGGTGAAAQLPTAQTDGLPSGESRFWSGDYYNQGNGQASGMMDKLKEECGVFGVFGHKDAAELSYYGLHALQHRGEESCGICTSDLGGDFHYHRGMGLVKEVFDRDRLDSLVGANAIGHVRYSTAGASRLANAQPLVFKYRGGDLAVCTNGNLVNEPIIRRELEESGSIFQTTSDTEVIAHMIARSPKDLVGAVKDAFSRLIGGFAFLIMTKDVLIAACDPNGLRPLVMGRLGDAYIFASESCSFEVIGAEYVRDVEPGELIVLDRHGIREERYAVLQRRSVCAMEYIYFARPDSDINTINLHSARKRMGQQLALESFVDADIVTGVPDSSISAAIGYAEQTGIPYELGLIKNKYTGRTFIQPSQELREKGVKMKLSAVRKVVQGKRVVMIDDSIVRGTTSLRIVNLLREAGALEVHVRITSPPFANPCYYGIDTPDRRDLIASSKTVEEIRKAINADSLYFLSKPGLLEAVGGAEGEYDRGLCLGCFTNDYPTPVEFEDAKATSCSCD